jgi:hypothetical protein
MARSSAQQSVFCSPVCLGIIAKNGRVSRTSGQDEHQFLCSQDWVAERVGFEARPVLKTKEVIESTTSS